MPQKNKQKPSHPIMAAQMTLKITNRSGAEVKVYLTLGSAAGCVQDIKAIPLVTHPVNRLQGWSPAEHQQRRLSVRNW